METPVINLSGVRSPGAAAYDKAFLDVELAVWYDDACEGEERKKE